MTIASRERILKSIRAATGESAGVLEATAPGYAELPRLYVHKGLRSQEETVALMIERLREYDAEVVESDPAALPETIAAVLTTNHKKILAAPPGLPAEWLVANIDWELDHGLSHEQIEAVEGVVTASFCGIADSGTIALHHSASEGRRVLTLLPDWHLCILRASQIVETLPEYFARCAEPPALATYISGPSATADIEMTRIKGVHGPRFLNVIVVRDELPA